MSGGHRSDHVKPVRQVPGDSSAENDSLSAKLVREADVFGLGTLEGMFHHAVSHPAEMIGEFAVGYAGVLIFSGLERRAGIGALTGQMAGLGMVCSYYKDIAGMAGTGQQIWKNTWNTSSIESLECNKSAIAESWGAFAADSAVTTWGGMKGARRGFLNNATRAMVQEVFHGNPKESGVVRILVDGGVGSGFFVNDRHIITARHVASNALNTLSRFRDSGPLAYALCADGAKLAVTVKAIDPHNDIAIMETEAPHNHKAMTLAYDTASLGKGASIAALGSQPLGFFRGAPGRYWNKMLESDSLRVIQDTTTALQQSYMWLKRSMQLRLGLREYRGANRDTEVLVGEFIGAGEGLSGAPLLDLSRKHVIGVLCASLLDRLALSVPIEDVHELMRLSEMNGRGELKTGFEAAQILGIDPQSVREKLISGELKGIGYPSQIDWESRVLLEDPKAG